MSFLPPTDPLRLHGFGGPEPSRLVDPGQWMLHADRLAASVPASPSEVAATRHAAVAQRLEEAAHSLDEVLEFIPAGQHEVPEEACWTPIGRVAYHREIGRFRSSRLRAVASTYRRLARRFWN